MSVGIRGPVLGPIFWPIVGPTSSWSFAWGFTQGHTCIAWPVAASFASPAVPEKEDIKSLRVLDEANLLHRLQGP